jgi:hypothetical protein
VPAQNVGIDSRFERMKRIDAAQAFERRFTHLHFFSPQAPSARRSPFAGSPQTHARGRPSRFRLLRV